MTITIIGASGFLGQNLIKHLLKTTDYQLRAFCRSANRLPFAYNPRITPVAGDIFDEQAIQKALLGAEAAVYLIHMMGDKNSDYYDDEARAAQTFAAAAQASKLPRVVYMSGLGDDSQHLSKHLASRHNTGKILRDRLPLVLELRASMIIGNGSVAYDIIKAIADKLPIVAVPRWAVTRTQPIILADALTYIQSALTVPVTTSQIIEIGGPEVLTYPQILERYTAHTGHRQHVFILPFVPHWAASWWLGRYLPDKDSDIGKAMVDSLNNEMVVINNHAQKLFPTVTCQLIEQGF